MSESTTDVPESNTGKQRLLRCMDWLQKQNSQEPKKSLQNKNDIQFIIQTNADRKNFLLSVAEDEATVPPGIGEPTAEPEEVPLRHLRVQNLRMECGWQSCEWQFYDYEELQKHVTGHISDLVVIKDEASGQAEYTCLWDICGHKTADSNEIVRHINFHAYHARLLAIGFNGRATLKLARCKKDSSKRNTLPPLNSDHCCMWTGCEDKFNSIQMFFDHVKLHSNYSDKNLCSWAGCGLTFPRKVLLTMHMRSHTCEKLIACYHCGAHFSCNRKLSDHVHRQNVYPNSSHSCTVCGVCCATEYLLREHTRQHISAYACALCDMSAVSRTALAQHVRYRHFAPEDARTHACLQCDYKAVTKSDLTKHIPTHTNKKRNRRKKKKRYDSFSSSDEENSEVEVKPKKLSTKKYACHMCPEKEMKVFSRGTRLTTHLVKVHGAQWPFGHSRFRYQISEDGMYRLTTTRFEFLEVSKKIVDGYSWPKESLTNSFEFNVELKAEATATTPRRFEVTVKGEEKVKETDNDGVEITMCDVDEHGNIINSEVINSGVVLT